MKSDLWPAPAKLNLFLHITGRRSDGYHNLQTLFQFIDYLDQIRFDIRTDRNIRRLKQVALLESEDDLTVRAARLLQEASGCTLGVDIVLEKNIPMGGGLGGGSSDAATTLVALNQLWGLHLPQTKLIELGAQLGADVPIFVHGHTAWAEGIGEQIQSVDVPDSWYVVIFPGVMVSTGQLFEDPELTRDARPIKIRDYFDSSAAGGTANVIENAFESIVRRRYPEVDKACEWLSNQSVNTLRTPMMTGTGSCVFAPFADEISAKEVAAKIELKAKLEVPNNWQVICAKSCSESPLVKKLKSVAGSD
jgi:4-diphosphocytidyl-2-C-methyl-D-erythritol kinase